jgi:hypothetical protein
MLLLLLGVCCCCIRPLGGPACCWLGVCGYQQLGQVDSQVPHRLCIDDLVNLA